MRDDFFSVVSTGFIGRIFGRGLRYTLTLVVANGLGPEAVGIVAFGLVVMKGMGTIARLGLDTAVQKRLPKFRQSGDDGAVLGLVGFSVVVPLALGSVLAMILLSIPTVVNIQQFDIFLGPVRVFIISTPLFAALSVATAVTRAYKQTKYDILIRDLVQSGSAVIFAAIGAFVLNSVFGVAVGYATSLVIGLLVAVVVFVRLGALRINVRPRIAVRETIALSAPLMFITVIQYVMIWTDILMLTALRTQSEVGLYQVAYQTAALLLLVVQAANMVFPAIAAELYEAEEYERLETIYSNLTKWIVQFTGLGLAGLMIFGRDILSLFGPSFETIGLILTVAAVGQFFTAASGPSGFLLSMTGNERLELVNNSIVGAINLGLNYILILEYGALGAAAATGVSLFLLNGLRVVEIYHIYGFVPYSRKYLSGLSGVLVTVAVMIMLRIGLAPGLMRAVIAAVVSIGIFTLVIRIKGLTEEDRTLLNSIS